MARHSLLSELWAFMRARKKWWLLPIIILGAVLAMVVSPRVIDVWTAIFPFLAEPSALSLQALAETPEKFVGAWSLVILQLLLLVGNYWLGEEFLFRSVLLPKMNGARC